MILQQAMMQLSRAEKDKVSNKISKLVMLHECGLAIHKGEEKNSKAWVISHFNSGRAVLQYLKTKEQAEKYVQLLHWEVMNSWTFTEKEWSSVDQETKSEIKKGVDYLQKEILENDADVTEYEVE